jgi:hypothetical protein
MDAFVAPYFAIIIVFGAETHTCWPMPVVAKILVVAGEHIVAEIMVDVLGTHDVSPRTVHTLLASVATCTARLLMRARPR